MHVANGPKSPGLANQTGKDPLAFEEALKKLQSIVEAMESEDLPLEKLLAHYEEGTRLAGLCQEKLAEAAVKIEKLEKTAAGELKLRPIEDETADAI